MGMYNLDNSPKISSARRSITAPSATIQPICPPKYGKQYDGQFMLIFQRILTEFKRPFDAADLEYQHRLIDDMAASAMKWSGGYVWPVTTRRRRAVRHGRTGVRLLGLMTSQLMTPDGKIS
jgi:isocitrate dehydrogenase